MDQLVKRSRIWNHGSWAKLALPAVAACLSLTGCSGFFDDVTSHEFKLNQWFTKSDPYAVLRDSNDGDHRAKAYRQLSEPFAHGGTEQDQTFVVDLLTKGATEESYAVCRLAAIQTLSTFKDPRTALALKDAYYKASKFGPEKATPIRCAALTGLGDIGSPEGVDLLVKVLREPPVEGPDADRRQKMDERHTAAQGAWKVQTVSSNRSLAVGVEDRPGHRITIKGSRVARVGDWPAYSTRRQGLG